MSNGDNDRGEPAGGAAAGGERGEESAPIPTVIDQMEDGPPYPERLKGKPYRKQLRELQIELVKCQFWIKETGRRVVIVFEGRDAAGKGGSIARFRENLNPRGAPHVALPKPSDTESTQWYFQRYVAHLPAAGEIIFFDRSWYNRAGVERVMGFCTARQYVEFTRQAPTFERSLVDSGIQLFKLWFTVSRDEQRRRFEARKTDPLRRWKLSPMDLASLDRWDDYTQARNDVLNFTDTQEAPWTVVNSNEKRRARIGAIRHVLASIDYDDKDYGVVARPDPRVVRPVRELQVPGLTEDV